MINKLWRLFADLLNGNEATSTEENNNLEWEWEIINLKTGRRLKGPYKGRDPKGDRIKIGSRWYDEADVSVRMIEVSDSKK